jgi:pimeloyl-ACP methyl ester carboxylesterase
MPKLICLVLLAIIVVCLFTLLVLLYWSPGRQKAFLGENGVVLENCISEKIIISINGVDQGMFIKGRDKNNPVLLFLHGGPGMPEYGLTAEYPTCLEDVFTVCWWEQRGAGLSYNSKIKTEEITIEQLVSDTIGVTEYLRERFNQEKIYLMGHSWGTLLGLYTAKKSPELYYAYIGIAQIANQLESEKIAYTYMIDQYEKMGNQKMVKAMKKYPIPQMDYIPVNYAAFRDGPMHSLGIGTMHNMKSVISGIFLPIMKNPEYTLTEKLNVWIGKSKLLNKTNLWEVMSRTNISEAIPKLDLPVYFFHGIYDYTVNYELTKEYYTRLEAPVKDFYTFGQSAHSPVFEEPDRVKSILLQDVLKRPSQDR